MLIGLTGIAQSGKDTTYRILRDMVDGSVRRDAFADRLKLSAAKALGRSCDLAEALTFCNTIKGPGFDILLLDPDGHVLQSLTGREYLQFYGTEAHREVFGTDFWVNIVLDQYDPGEILIITDTRFDNEAQAIRDRGGIIWKIQRPELERIAESGHGSEQGISVELIDLMVLNDRGLDELHDAVAGAYLETLAQTGNLYA
jgi:hypothetical protein